MLLAILFTAAAAPALTGLEVLDRMDKANEARQRRLISFESTRRYEAGNTRFGRKAHAIVEVFFRAPGEKTFRVIERAGTRIIQGKVINPLMEVEKANSTEAGRAGTEISRRNYRFTYLGLEGTPAAHLFSVEPLTRNKYLFRGKMWVDAESFAVRRTEGEPAQSPSFWVIRTRFVHEYGNFGGFWFPVKHRTETELRLFGKSTLSIDYYDYRWEPRDAR